MTDDGDSALFPDREDANDEGVSRRRLLRTSTATGAAAAAAGCVGGDDEGDAATVFVFNTGDKTVSLLDPVRDEVVGTQYLGTTASFPANQYTPTVTGTGDDAALWLNVDGGVKAVDPRTLETTATLETGARANWQVQTPDAAHLVVSAREPVHRQYRVDADPSSESFGEVTATLTRAARPGEGEGSSEDDGSNGQPNEGGPGPSGLTLGPEGEYAFVPDVFDDAVSVLDVAALEVVARVDLDPVTSADTVRPWMAAADWTGDRLLVTNNEGDHGTASVLDVSDPTAPVESARLTETDGLGRLPLTSAIGPEGRVAYVFTPRSLDVTVVDLLEGAVTDRIDVGGKAFVGSWGPAREKLYLPVQTGDVVKVIDHGAGEVTATLSVGSKPYGVTAAGVRPEADAVSGVLASIASLDYSLPEEESTYCVEECHCGLHESDGATRSPGHDH